MKFSLFILLIFISSFAKADAPEIDLVGPSTNDESLLGFGPSFQFETALLSYTVQITPLQEKTPNCSELRTQLNKAQSGLSEIEKYTDKIDRGISLTSSEIQQLDRLSSGALENLSNTRSQVELQIRWRVISDRAHGDHAGVFFMLYGAKQFETYHLTGPGLDWRGPMEHNNSLESEPIVEKVEDTHIQRQGNRVVDINANAGIDVTYRLPLEDFCFANSELIAEGLGPASQSESGSKMHPKLSAIWKRDLLRRSQTGYTNFR